MTDFESTSPAESCGTEKINRSGTTAAKEYPLPPSVTGTLDTAAGPVPQLATRLDWRDRMGMIRVRWGIGRMNYAIRPGLYAVGQPGRDSEVLVTANYRMTFDLLRSALKGLDVWILVLDTRGINVWCAAGKGTFGTDELVSKIRDCDLASVTDRRRLILPQLGAPGVAAHRVRELSGLRVVYGPIEARDIPAFLAANLKTTPGMRVKSFPIRERASLIPMELVPSLKYGAVIAAVLTILSGFLGRGTFASDALHAGLVATMSLGLAVVAGAVVVPLLLPYLPGRAFSLKGMWTGLAAASGLAAAPFPSGITLSGLELTAWFLLIPALSSFLGLNFTGSSTYTSLSGVRREMRVAVPLQAGASAVGLAVWIMAILLPGGGAL